MEFLQAISETVWGAPLILLVVATGLYYTFRLVFIQVRYFGFGIRVSLGRADREEGDKDRNKKGEVVYDEWLKKQKKWLKGEISYFQSLTTSLGATIGAVNIVAVCVAILMGGPGVLFWMWVMAFLAMSTQYAESLLTVKYRTKTARGYSGGPMYYISMGLGWKWLGSVFAILVLLTSLGVGNLIQVQTTTSFFSNSQSVVAPHYIAIAIAVVVAFIILGGIRRIGRVTSVLVPLMILIYIGGCTWFIIKFSTKLNYAFYMIFKYAFNPMTVISGGLLGVLQITMRQGISQGAFSSQASFGNSSIVAAAAKTKYTVKQGLVSMLAPFVDTIVICTMTGITFIIGFELFGKEIITSLVSPQGQFSSLTPKFSLMLKHLSQNPDGGIWSAMIFGFGKDLLLMGPSILASIFSTGLGSYGTIILLVSVTLFSVTAVLSWYYFSNRALVYLTRGKYRSYYQTIYILVIVLGGLLAQSQSLWYIAKIFNGLMALPNIIALLALAPIVVKETKEFFKKYPHKHDLLIQIYMVLLRMLPKNLVSRLFGMLASLQPPRFIKIPLLLAFAKLNKINMSESELELKDYKSLNNFFTRALKNGARIIDPDNQVVVSPVDGTLIKFGSLTAGALVQSKGIESSLRELLGSKTHYKKFLGGYYYTIYLSPQDYHRIHSPVTGNITGYYYQPGSLFPVNSIAVSTVNRLFSRNERLLTFIQTENGMVAMVKVGATTVGKVKVVYDEKISTNRWVRFSKEHEYKEPIHIKKGDEIGRFEMGSTVILLFEKNMIDSLELEEYQRVLFGEAIASYKKDIDRE